jgi:predicted metal-binding protein
MVTIATKICASANSRCKGACSGYGTQAACPPLIVLAVLSSQKPAPA